MRNIISQRSGQLRVLFFGTDAYSVQHLKHLNHERLSNSGVVSTIGVVTLAKKEPVYKYARASGLHVHPWPLDAVTLRNYDIGVLASFGRIVPRYVIDALPQGIFNSHPSLLPRWRGAAPILHTILQGDSLTGISVMKIKPYYFDIGPLVAQCNCPVPKDVTGFQLLDHLALMGSKFMCQVLKDISHRTLFAQPAHIRPTHAPKPNVKMSRLDWHHFTADQMWRLQRAVGQVYPLRTVWSGETVKLLDMVSPSSLQAEHLSSLRELEDYFGANPDRIEPGSIYVTRQGLLCVKCKDTFVGFNRLQLRKKMQACDFSHGYLKQQRHSAKGRVFHSHRNLIFERIPGPQEITKPASTERSEQWERARRWIPWSRVATREESEPRTPRLWLPWSWAWS